MIIKKMANRAFNDEYLKKMLYKIEIDYCERIINSRSQPSITEKELYDLLRFSDILCRSSESNHRNLSLKIISILLEFKEFNENEYFNATATNTLVKLGNFPSLNIIHSFQEYLKIEEIQIDYILKNIDQNSPLGHPFTDSQLMVFEELKKRNHYSFSGSTSFGKSFIFEAFTKYLIEEHNGSDNIAFIVPTKALINQVSHKLKNIIFDSGYRVISTPKIPKVLMNDKGKYIFVFTAERLISYFLDLDNPKIDYLFVDEAHKLLNKKDTRTPLLYHALILAKRKSVNIYFASPNIPNASIFLELINNSTDESMTIDESPVAQNKFFINCIDDESYMISEYGKDIYFPKIGFTEDTILNLKKVLDEFSNNRQSIIYCNTVDKTINTAIKIADKYTEVNNHQLTQLIDLIDDKIHHQYYLRKCLKKGIAYHFGGIPEEIKEKVEELYRNGIIKYVFCTSTLLEGVNLPAKNIFILSEKIGMSKMSSIDFWNLAGRAGRLRKDLSGNIFCVNLFNQDGYWKNEDNIKMLREKKIESVKPQIMSKANDNLYKNLANYLQNKEFTNNRISEDQRKSFEMYGNILIYHDSINSDSILKDNFLDFNKDALVILKKTRNSLKVPSEILAKNIDIDFESQNRIMETKSKVLPKETNYETCLEVLNILYDQYKWEVNESKGRNAIVKSREQLLYYATIMDSWINAKSLKYLIQKTINYYYNNGKERNILIGQSGKKTYVKFNKEDDAHINELINNIIKDIENVLRFKVKNYVSNYQALLETKQINIESDWESYIEYGTTDQTTIAIQNLGFSRSISIFLKDFYYGCFIKDNLGFIYDINESELKEKFDKRKYFNEYQEIAKFLGWDEDIK